MVTLASSSGKPKYNIKEYYLDSPSDLAELNTLTADAPGSRAKVISSGDLYIQNSQGEWILQPATAGGSSSGGDSGSDGETWATEDDIDALFDDSGITSEATQEDIDELFE